MKKIKDLTRECNLLKDIINKIENNKKEQIEELYKRTKEKDLNVSSLHAMNKSIEKLQSEMEVLADEKIRLRKEIDSLNSEYNFY